MERDGVQPADVSDAWFAGGGWLVLSIPLVGDVLQACPTLAADDPSCESVLLPMRGPGASLEPWFVHPETGSAWFMVSVPTLGDWLLACYEPAGAAWCSLVEIEERPDLASLSMLERRTGDEGGLPISLPGQGAPAPTGGLDAGVPCDASADLDCNPAAFWMEASLPGAGAVALYACAGLDDKPACHLAASTLAFVDAKPFGLRDLEVVRTRSGVQIKVGEVASGSAAYIAGLRGGELITTAAGFELHSPLQLKGLLDQVPVGESVRLEVEGKGLVKLTRQAGR